MVANATGSWASEPVTFLFALACLLIVVTILGNVLVVVAFVKEPSLQALTNYWIVSLSCTDLILATVVMPIFIVDEINGPDWQFGSLFCDVFITMDVLCCTCSIYHLVLISLDRYFCVRHPLTYPKRRTRQSTLIAICCTWLICAVISVPRLLGWKDPSKQPSSCHLTNTSYKLFSSMLSFFLPTLLIIWTYVSIYFLTQQQAARIQKYSTHSASQQSPSRANLSFRSKGSIADADLEHAGAEPSSGLLHPPTTVTVHIEDDIVRSPTGDTTTNSTATGMPQTFRLSVCSFDRDSRTPSFTQKLSETFGAKRSTPSQKTSRMTRLERNRQRQEQKAAKVVTVVVSVFLVSWTPFFVMNVYDAVCHCVTPIVWRTVTWLGYANSAVNPLIYTLFNPTFRQTIVLILGCKRSEGRRLRHRRRAVFG